MPTPEDLIGELFVEHFNLDLAALPCPARVAMPAGSNQKDVLALLSEDGTVLAHIPSDAAPEMVAIAVQLHGRGLNHGARAGEEAAWAKLRSLIGAAAA
jgi:hypothetical protein